MAEPAGERRDLPWFPAVSPDGTKVAFSSDASNFGPADGNGGRYVYVRDLTTGVTALVSVRADGSTSSNGRSYGSVSTADSAAVVFESEAEPDLSKRPTPPKPPSATGATGARSSG